MNSIKCSFQNSQGDLISGILELPLNQEPHSFVLFAHCFTCNKNFFAPKNISRTLSEKGYGVLRFDFTGLGESEGDFSQTNFSGNVEDLVAAAEFLKKKHQAPELLIGHSLGGAAALFASEGLPSVKAVVTIGSPSSPVHVKHLLRSEIDEIKKQGMAKVNVGGRDFQIKEQFLNDLESHRLQDIAEKLHVALLVMHSPQDEIVEIKNAEELYTAARHPKSFVSLDGADHLLSTKEDSQYAGNVIASWASRYLSLPEDRPLETDHEVVANLGSEGFTTQVRSGRHYFVSDEPVSFGGKNFGPSPYDFLSAALASCTSMTIQMYSRRKKWPLTNAETHVNHHKNHAKDCQDCKAEAAKIDHFERHIVLKGDLTEDQKTKLLQIADKCPVHKTLSSQALITTELEGM